MFFISTNCKAVFFIYVNENIPVTKIVNKKGHRGIWISS